MISYEKTTNAFHDGTQAYECSRISQDDVNSVSGVLSFISFTVDTVRRLPIFSLPFKVTPDLRGVLREKNSHARHFKGNKANYISLERLMNVNFGEKMRIAGFFNSAKENHKQPRK